MRKSFIQIFTAVSLAVICSVSVSAQGFSTGGFYASAGSGGNYLESNEGIDYDFGFVFGGAFGYDTGTGLRGEFAVSYSDNGVDSVNGVSLDGSGVDASVGLLSFASKAYWDFHLSDAPIVPYLGAVAGWTRSNEEVAVSDSGVTVSVSANENYFTYGPVAGFRIPFADGQFSAGAEYGYTRYGSARIYYHFQ